MVDGNCDLVIRKSEGNILIFLRDSGGKRQIEFGVFNLKEDEEVTISPCTWDTQLRTPKARHSYSEHSPSMDDHT